MTFEWEEITDEVLKKVVLVQFISPSTSGFIDSDGSLTAITEDGQEYLIGFEKMSWKKTTEVLTLFLGERPKTNNCFKFSFEMENWYWDGFFSRNTFIRSDYFGKIYFEWMKQREKKLHTPATEVAKNLLDPQGKLPRMVLAATQAKWDKYEKG